MDEDPSGHSAVIDESCLSCKGICHSFGSVQGLLTLTIIRSAGNKDSPTITCVFQQGRSLISVSGRWERNHLTRRSHRRSHPLACNSPGSMVTRDGLTFPGQPPVACTRISRPYVSSVVVFCLVLLIVAPVSGRIDCLFRFGEDLLFENCIQTIVSCIQSPNVRTPFHYSCDQRMTAPPEQAHSVNVTSLACTLEALSSIKNVAKKRGTVFGPDFGRTFIIDFENTIAN